MIRIKDETMVKDRPKKPVVQKTRTASPSAKADRGGGEKPPKVPIPVAPAEGPKFIPVTVSLDQPLIDRLDEWAHGQRLTRSAAAREVLTRGLK